MVNSFNKNAKSDFKMEWTSSYYLYELQVTSAKMYSKKGEKSLEIPLIKYKSL